MLPRLWLLVGSDRPTDRPTDRQCHLLSCPGQLKMRWFWMWTRTWTVFAYDISLNQPSTKINVSFLWHFLILPLSTVDLKRWIGHLFQRSTFGSIVPLSVVFQDPQVFLLEECHLPGQKCASTRISDWINWTDLRLIHVNLQWTQKN